MMLRSTLRSISRTAAMLALTGACATAQAGLLTDDAPFVEGALQLPSAPAAAELRAFDVSMTSALQYSIDTASLSYGADRVWRYTVVIDSPEGARNVLYQGLRCDVRETKVFATYADGRWRTATRSNWQPIISGPNGYQAALASDWLCDNEAPAGPVEAVVRQLRRR